MIPILTKDGVVSKKIARALGSAMWMYDLTGGWRIGKLHQRICRRAGRSPTCPRCPSRQAAAPATCTTTPAPTTPGSRSPSPAPQRHAAPWSPTAARVVDVTARRRRSRRRCARCRGRRSTVRIVAARCVVNAAGVWADEVRALDEGTDPDIDPTGQGRPRHRPVGEGAQRHRGHHPGAEGQAQPVPRAVGPNGPTARSATSTSAPPTPTTTAARRSAVHGRRHRLRAAALNDGVDRNRITRDDITGVWAGTAPTREGGVGRRRQRQDRRSVASPSGCASATRASSRSPAAS